MAKLGASAGKPLEVATAESFVRKAWKARLGSYFVDGALDVARELDVFAERESRLPSGLPVRVRALISCKAFPQDRSPIAYSVLRDSALSFTPGLLTSHRSPTTLGPLSVIEERAALQLLQNLQLGKSDPTGDSIKGANNLA